eukprot:5572100-Amphidinium_carterae.1
MLRESHTKQNIRTVTFGCSEKLHCNKHDAAIRTPPSPAGQELGRGHSNVHASKVLCGYKLGQRSDVQIVDVRTKPSI